MCEGRKKMSPDLTIETFFVVLLPNPLFFFLFNKTKFTIMFLFYLFRTLSVLSFLFALFSLSIP
jgi:hypothetical protein